MTQHLELKKVNQLKFISFSKRLKRNSRKLKIRKSGFQLDPNLRSILKLMKI
jgi:hypothetical protein